MNMKYEIKPLTEEEETFIEEKINGRNQGTVL